MAAGQACPRCGKPIRNAKGCVCGQETTTTPLHTSKNGRPAPAAKARWEWPLLDQAIERRFRQFTLPMALLIAWIFAHAGFARTLMRTWLSMWIHELGHAVAAWLCGRFAFPGPWFTPVGQARSFLVMLVVAAAIGFAAYRLWPARKAWAVAVALLWPLQAICSFSLSRHRADAFIIWAGDGGCMLIGTLLLLSFYAHESSPLRKGWLRWGFVVIGAAAFADTFATWWAARTDRDIIPFGEIEGRGESDPTVLVFEHGFSISGLVNSFLWTGVLCLGILVVAYLWGLRRQPPLPDEP
ncbi:MAG TPA: hypothetical protein VF518_00805 [Polyangia bacterium]